MRIQNGPDSGRQPGRWQPLSRANEGLRGNSTEPWRDSLLIAEAAIERVAVFAFRVVDTQNV